MSDDWLWSGGEPPDPDEAKRVAALRGLKRDRALGALPPRASRRWIAPVAALALAAAAVWVMLSGGDWRVRAIRGAAPCPTSPCVAEVGTTWRPGPGDRWGVDLAGYGELVLEGGAVFERTAGVQGKLTAGKARVEANAPAGLIRLSTPAADVVDLGCAFEVMVAPELTELTVKKGTVALENAQGKAVVAGGHAAMAGVGKYPSIPIRLDASPAFTAVVRAGNTKRTLEHARPEDLFTLWHVLQVVPEGERAEVVDKMVALEAGAAPPDRDALLRLDPGALTTLWQDVAPRAYRETP